MDEGKEQEQKVAGQLGPFPGGMQKNDGWEEDLNRVRKLANTKAS